MPLSGAAMISENTAVASSNRCTGSLTFAVKGVRASAATRIDLIFHLFQSAGLTRHAFARLTSFVQERCQLILGDVCPLFAKAGMAISPGDRRAVSRDAEPFDRTSNRRCSGKWRLQTEWITNCLSYPPGVWTDAFDKHSHRADHRGRGIVASQSFYPHGLQHQDDFERCRGGGGLRMGLAGDGNMGAAIKLPAFSLKPTATENHGLHR